MANKNRLSRGEKALIIIPAIILIIAVAGFFYWRYLETDPVVSIPAPAPPPSPNAYDDFVKASKLITDPQNLLHQFSNDYRHGAKIIPGPLPKILPERSMMAKPGANSYWQKELDAALVANEPAMATLRGGFRHPCVVPPMRPTTSFSKVSTDTAGFRSFARLMNGYGCALESRGESGKAMECYLDATEMNVEITHGAPLFVVLVSIALEAISRDSRWECSKKLTSAEARTAALRLEEINRKRTPLADVLQEEKLNSQASMLESFKDKNWRDIVSEGGGSDLSIADKLSILTASKQKVMFNYSRCMDSLIIQVREPYPVMKKLPAPVAGDGFTKSMLIDVDLFATSILSFQTQGHLLATSLALRAYRLEHGAYPATLSDLVAGKYLTAIPGDPFAMKAPLQYRRVGANYVLYSIGPDSVDDGGKPSADGTKGSRKATKANSIGDIVAGVNLM